METVSNSLLKAVISLNEFKSLLKDNTLDKENLVLISISEPVGVYYADTELTQEDVVGFKDSLRVKFWDIEKDFNDYKVISDEIAKEIKDFIVKNIDSQFIIHCKAGQSRSAGVAKAVELIKHFGTEEDSKYLYLTSFSSDVSNHPRYSPNLTVFDKIVDSK